MISKKIVAVGLSVVLSTLLFGETKPKKQTVQVKQPKSEVIKKDPNEYEVSRTDVMPKPQKPDVVRDYKKETVYDPTTKLMWQDNSEVKSNKRNWQSAIEYCENLSFAGYSDWKLPTLSELRSIVEHGRFSPTIKLFFGNIGTYDDCWSSTPSAGKSNDAWRINFYSGGDSTYNKNDGYLVRCVRNSN